MHSALQTRRFVLALSIAAILVSALALPPVRRLDPNAQTAEAASCFPNAGIQHAIYIQFDNTHFSRDKANVPSDLEQMPHLLNFLTSNGTLLTNDHTILISHTGGGILSTLTGLYPDHHGQAVSNSYRYFTGTGSSGTNSSSSFKYWTDLADDVNAAPLDSSYNMVTESNKNTPAPWVPFTRAGCDVGGVGVANIELENTAITPHGDITSAFGNPSPEAAEATGNATLAQADFVGIAIHCAKTGGICPGKANLKPDLLPDEPLGYNGYQALFGAKYVNPAIASAACVNDTDGQPIKDPSNSCGFPGFDAMFAKNTLGYVAQMQEAGVPVTFAYISDAHDNHTPPTYAYGPGEAGYKAQLKAYDDAFAAFFTRLASHGITKANTLFVITVDEGDHFAGGTGIAQPDGSLAYSHTNCVPAGCPSNAVGEVNLNLGTLFTSTNEPGVIYTVHSDSAPAFYVTDATTKAPLARNDPKLRKLERDVGVLTEPDPFDSSASDVLVSQRLVDSVGEKSLHMVTGDPKRTPSFVSFQNPDFFSFSSGTNPNCPTTPANPCEEFGFAWNHGDIQDEIGSTWLGMVGPGIDVHGVDRTTWTDHVNVRPTMLALLGLKDDYIQDGRVLAEVLGSGATPKALQARKESYLKLAEAYEQLNAPFGEFNQDALKVSTKALKSDSDSVYNRLESSLQNLTSQRDDLASGMRQQLNDAAFNKIQINDARLNGDLIQARILMGLIGGLAAAP